MAQLADIDIAYQSSLKSFWMMGYRHLDNLLLTKDGRLFHIDFGFILGRDPKPFPPPMKLCKEMVEAMGGAERYTLFPKMLNPNFLVWLCLHRLLILFKSMNIVTLYAPHFLYKKWHFWFALPPGMAWAVYPCTVSTMGSSSPIAVRHTIFWGNQATSSSISSIWWREQIFQT